MNRTLSLVLCVLTASSIFCSARNRAHAQAVQPVTPSQTEQKPANAKAQAEKPASTPSTQEADEDDDAGIFTPQPAPPLPAGMTGSDANDPRAKLAPGLYDAGEAAMGIKHLLLFKKPDAFQLGASDPNDPKVQRIVGQLGMGNNPKIPKAAHLEIAQLAFANSDLAFLGTHLFQGSFYGMNIYDISDPANVQLLTSMVCPGGQGDVSVYKNLMFMSVEMPNGRLDCGVQGFPVEPEPAEAENKDKAADKDAGKDGAASADKGQAADKAKDDKDQERRSRIPAAQKDRFRGVRIFDSSDIRNPKQVAAVQTCRGSHTHTLVLDPNDKQNVYIYVSGTSFVRQPEELAGCSGEKPDKDPNTALFRIDVIKVPVAAPQDAKIVSSPRVFMDARTGAINSLLSAGSHEKGHEKPEETDQCHDITVYTAIGLAAGACSGNGIVLDIKDPVHPKRLDAVNDPNY